MKHLSTTVQVSTTLSLFLLLGACGGGGGGASAPPPVTTPVPSVVSQGAITAKGSVFVNGIEFDTRSATIKIDDVSGLDSDLKVGMVVKVRGTSDDATRKGVASLVEARDALEGSIDTNGVDSINRTITVSGQKVRIEDNVTRLNDDDTIKVFAGANFQAGDRVEIHGFPDDQGGLRATRVIKKASGEFELKGFVNHLATTSFDLSLAPGGATAVTVTFTAGSLPGGVVNGSRVEVKSLSAPVAGTVAASQITLEDKVGATGEKAEVEGLVTSGTVADFSVNGQRVLTTSTTLFDGGLKSDFAIGLRLEAEGPLDATGALVAVRISFRSSIKIEADASAVTAGGLTVLGKAVAINPLTRVDNGPIANGDHLEIRASLDRDGNLVAARIIKQSASTRAFLQAPVTAKDAATGSFTMLGLILTTSSQTELRKSSDSSEAAVDAATFFAQITPNVTVVKVRWDAFSSLTQPVKQAEIELGK